MFACLDAEAGDSSSRYIVAMAFSPCGQKLVVVTGDNRHTVGVYAWRTKELLYQGVGHNGQPPQVIPSTTLAGKGVVFVQKLDADAKALINIMEMGQRPTY